jgi:hypothetical protein
MFKAYVGIASSAGLAVLHPESDHTLSLVRSRVQGDFRQVAFWVVLEELEARTITALALGGLPKEALTFLDCTARHLGRILPSDASRLH